MRRGGRGGAGGEGRGCRRENTYAHSMCLWMMWGGGMGGAFAFHTF